MERTGEQRDGVKVRTGRSGGKSKMRRGMDRNRGEVRGEGEGRK